MNRRNFLATIAGAMAYAGLRIEMPKAPEIALKTTHIPPITIPNWENFYVVINGKSWVVEEGPITNYFE